MQALHLILVSVVGTYGNFGYFEDNFEARTNEAVVTWWETTATYDGMTPATVVELEPFILFLLRKHFIEKFEKKSGDVNYAAIFPLFFAS